MDDLSRDRFSEIVQNLNILDRKPFFLCPSKITIVLPICRVISFITFF
jgi:hypothetical protein